MQGNSKETLNLVMSKAQQRNIELLSQKLFFQIAE
jgi:hypothetical protein